MSEPLNKKIENENLDGDTSLIIVKKVISNVFKDLDQNEIQPDIELEVLGLDSIKFLNILLGFQDTLDLNLDDLVELVDLSKLHKVQDIVNLVDEFKKINS